jgi:hypothetical protein
VFAVSFLLLMSVAGCTAVSLKNIAKDHKVTNVWSANASLFSLVAALGFISFYTEDISASVMAMLRDWRSYLLLGLEFTAFYLSRQNFVHNGDDVTSIKCAMLLSLIFVPILSFTMTPLMGFEFTLTVGYSSPFEFMFMIGSLALFLVGYFYDKVNCKVNSWPLLIAAPLALSFSMFVGTKMIQTHDGYAVMGFVSFFNACVFGCWAMVRGQFSQPLSLRSFFVTASCGILMVPLNVMALSMVAVEFVVVLKRSAQILVGVLIDAFYHRSYTLGKKDTLLIFILVVTSFTYYHIKI